jgi:type II secretory pathway component PulJ
MICHRIAKDLRTKTTEITANGFSLLELLVGLGLAAVIMVAVVSVFATLTRSYTTQNASASAQQAVRSGVDYMAQNIRMAGLNPANLTNVGILVATPTSIEFTVDRNLNGTIDEFEEEHMAFAFISAQQRINQGLYIGTPSQSWTSLIENVSNMVFNYYDDVGDDLGITPDLAEIRSVEIMLTVAMPAGRQGMVNRTYSARVRCRNLSL